MPTGAFLANKLTNMFLRMTLQSVQFINKTYISTKINAESKEGLLLAKKFNVVEAYPTLLFLDKRQHILGRVIGTRARDDYFEAIKTAGKSEEKRSKSTK